MSSWMSFKIVALAGACLPVLLAQLPAGWFLAGTRPAEYDCGIESIRVSVAFSGRSTDDPDESFDSQGAMYLRSKPDRKTSDFGTLMQSLEAGQYVGKRVRFSAFVKSEGIEPDGTPTAWSGLWMRVDDGSQIVNGRPKVMAFDNMQNRPILHTTPWQRYAVVLDVPDGATGICLGILLHGSGAVWMSGVKLEAVGRDVKVTGMSLRRN